MSGYIELHGRGLHSGARASLRLDARPGPLLFRLGPDEAGLDQLELVRADRGVCLRARGGSHSVDLCEHLLSALAGTCIRSGLVISLAGPEVPLLDGGSAELALALMTLGLRREPSRLVVTRAGELVDGESRYRFEPGDSTAASVDVDFPGVGPEHAEHGQDVARYLAEIAPARTFGFEHEARQLRADGRASHVDPAAVLVLDANGQALPPSRSRTPGELARHKLLDLMGDLYLYGGPPRGRVSAERPGHEATHRTMERALGLGVLARI